MKFLPLKPGAWALRIASTFSLTLLVVFAWGGPYTDLNRRLASVQSPVEARKLLESSKLETSKLDDFDGDLSKGGKDEQKRVLDDLRDYVASHAQAENFVDIPGAKEQIQKIKSSPLYKDDRSQSANWFSKAAENFWRTLKKLFHFDSPKPKNEAAPDLSALGMIGNIVVYFVWFILLAAVIAFGYFAIRMFRWKLNLKRRAKALLEEDEPERTLDEWLARADLLESEGKYREAIRCLYLACLLRFDEAKIARFDRGQTNWEHLKRIQASPKLPLGIDFEPTTRAFDHIWYGMRTRGKPDVDQFREWYVKLTDQLMVKAA